MKQYVLAKIELPILINEDGTYKIESEHTNITFGPLSQLPPKQSKKQIALSELLEQLGGNHSNTAKITLDTINDDDKGLIFRNVDTYNDESQTDIHTSNDDDDDDDDTKDDVKTDSNHISEGGNTQIETMYIPNKNGKPRKRNHHGTTFKNTQYHTSKYTRRVY